MKTGFKRGLSLLIVMLMLVSLMPLGIMAKETLDEDIQNKDVGKSSLTYQTHVQNVGWQNWKNAGEMSGTSGESLRLEGIRIKLNDVENLGVSYQTHIQNIGWEAETNRGWKNDGAMSGTEGLSYRLEGIQIKLTGADAEKYDIYYQVHAQNIGWMGWAKNGENAGTAGYSYRLEGIRIQILPKGSAAPNDNVTYPEPFKENIASPYSPILQEYRIAEASGFSYDVIKSLPNVNDNLSGSYKTKLHYIVEDISGDSSPELVIGMYSSNDFFLIYDIYRLNSGVPERIFDVNLLGSDRVDFVICENNIIRMRQRGYRNIYHLFYKLDGNLARVHQEIESDVSSGVAKYYLTDANNHKRLITETEANNIIDSYIPRSDINWLEL